AAGTSYRSRMHPEGTSRSGTDTHDASEGYLRTSKIIARSQVETAMHRKMLLSILVATCFGAGPALAQELTGTLKKIKETGAITLGHRESSVPFSYYDDRQQVVGYAMDLCAGIVDRVKSELKLPKLETKLNPVTSATRIPLMAN